MRSPISRCQEYFGDPEDARTHMTLHFGVGVLLILTLPSYYNEWSRSFAVWGYGRSWPLAEAPYAIFAVAVALSWLFFLGIKSRWTGLACCIALGGIYQMIPSIYLNNVYLLWLLCLLNSSWAHRSYAPSMLWRSRDVSIEATPAVVRRITQWQIVIVYLYSACAKITHPMWQGSGRMVSLIVDHSGLLRNGWWSRIIASTVLRSPFALKTVDVSVITLECAIPLMLMNRPLRRWGFILGIIMHVCMEESIKLVAFTFLMLLSYYAFVPSGDFAYHVQYDPASRLDIVMRDCYARLDWLGRTRWTSGATGSRLTLTGPDELNLTGFLALRQLLILTPASLLLYATASRVAPNASIKNTSVALVAAAWIPGFSAAYASLYERIRRAANGV